METPQHTPTRHRGLAAALLAGTALAGIAASRPLPLRAAGPAAGTVAPGSFTASASGPVTFSGTLDRSAVKVGGDGTVRMELKLGAESRQTTNAKRGPTDLVVILDRSGSMSGEKIVHARASVNELIRSLDDGDRFALVSYSSGSELTVPLAPATATQRERWRAVVNGIEPEGGTNMAAGLDAALNLLARVPRVGATRVILISDGLANEGDFTPEGLVGRAQRAAQREVVLTTVGVGDDFNEHLMMTLADAGTGNYYFVQRANELEQVFAKEFGAARSTVASAVTVEIEPAPGVRVVDAAGYPLETNGNRVVFRPGSLFSGQQRQIWVTLAVPQDQAVTRPLGSFAVTYRDGERAHRAAFAQTPTVACVESDDAFFAAVDVPAWERAVSVESYNKMQDEVARQVKGGNREGAKTTIARFREETRRMNEKLKSPAVAKKLETTAELEAKVDDAFVGANAPAKQNHLSKSQGAAAYDARRAGSKF